MKQLALSKIVKRGSFCCRACFGTRLPFFVVVVVVRIRCSATAALTLPFSPFLMRKSAFGVRKQLYGCRSKEKKKKEIKEEKDF